MGQPMCNARIGSLGRTRGCRNYASKGSVFCYAHQDHTPPKDLKLPLGGEAMDEPTFRTKSQDVIRDMIEMKNRLAKLGLWTTFHKIDTATTAVGYEVAAQLQLYERREQ